MKTLIASLLALVISAPLAWAEPEQALEQPIPAEERAEIEKIEAKQEHSEKSSKDEKIDRLFDLISKEIDQETSDLSHAEKQEIHDSLAGARDILKEMEGEVSINLGGETPFMGMLTGLFAVILIFGGPIIIVAIVLYNSFRKRRLTHETINNYVASGKDIPSEVLQGLQKQENPKSNLHKGMTLVGLGLGIMGFFYIVDAIEAMGFGLIPLLIGLAQLLVWKLESKNSDLAN